MTRVRLLTKVAINAAVKKMDQKKTKILTMQLIQGMPNWKKARQSNSLKLFFVFAYGEKSA